MAHGGPDYSTSTLLTGAATTINPLKPYNNNDAAQHTTGTVYVYDKAHAQSALACTVKGDLKVLGVQNDPVASAGGVVNLLYDGEGLVLCDSAVTVGQVLITGNTTAGYATPAAGTANNQNGYVGTVLVAGGPGLVLCDISCRPQLWGGAVAVEGTTWGSVNASHAPGNLQCGSNGLRYAFCVNEQWSGVGVPALPVTPPTLNGSNMSQIATTTFTVSTAHVRITLYTTLAPPTGLQAVTNPTTAVNTDLNIFGALSGVSQSTPIGTPEFNALGGSSVSASCVDAVPGDSMIGVFNGVDNPTFLSRGAGQTSFNQGSSVQAYTIIWDADTKLAANSTDSENWQTTAAALCLSATIFPVHPG
jgi:hypothetical protein